MLDIIYFSNVSGNTEKFVSKLDWKGKTHRIPIKGTCEFSLFNSYVLICPSYGEANHGHVPPQVRKFLSDPEYRSLCVGVIGSGSLNFGDEYALAGDMIAMKLQVPMFYKFDLAGNIEDVEKVKTGLLKFGQAGKHEFHRNNPNNVEAAKV